MIIQDSGDSAIDAIKTEGSGRGFAVRRWNTVWYGEYRVAFRAGSRGIVDAVCVFVCVRAVKLVREKRHAEISFRECHHCQVTGTNRGH